MNPNPLKPIFLAFSLVLINVCALAQTSGYSGTGANIDVTYHRINWRINPDSTIKAIGGSVTTYFVAKQAGVNFVTFDLNDVFTSVTATYTRTGAAITVTRPSTNIIRLALPVTLALNAMDSVTINYNGTPPPVNSQAEGYQKKASAGNNYIYTLSESYEDRDWWPCKADMQDKVDSMSINISVPNGFRAATNGKLLDSVLYGSNRIYRYKSLYPIATYLVAVGVAKYYVFDRGTVNINGTNVPTWYFIFPGKTAGTYSNMLTAMDFSKAELTAFSSKFGDYPFKNDKHGYYEFGWGGGMEHQSFSAMSAGSMTSWGTIAHELGHQWFGDKVTFGTWNELWLAEGFARYCEALAAELVPGLGQDPVTERGSFKTAANNTTNRAFSCYIPNATIATSNTLWNSTYGTTVYERGAMVVSMLRTLLGDTKFFQACQNYLNDPLLAFKSATTTDLKNHMQAVTGGYDLTAFFNSYVYGNGYPTYSIQWSPGTNQIKVRVASQSKSAGSTVGYYSTPIALRVRGSVASQDTVIVLYDQNGQVSRAGNGVGAAIASKTISFPLAFTPTTVTFDPYNQTLATGTTVLSTTLPVLINDFTVEEKNYGNELKLSLFDQFGELSKVVLQKSTDGVNFKDAGLMIKATSTTTLLNFTFIDYTPESGKVFYRARVEEVNESKYTKTVMVENRTMEKVLVVPNPANKQVLVKWTKQSSGNSNNADVKIISLYGQTVWNQQTGDNYININTESIAAGTYIVQVKQNNIIVLNKKLVIQR